MRFAITASDRYLGVFESFVNAGWIPVKLFTIPEDNKTRHSKAVIEYAQKLALDVQFSRLMESDLRELSQLGCDILIVASYDWRIPDWQPYLKYAINFHPSLLPENRGPYPLVQALLDDKKSWGITCHKLSAEFDTGDLIAVSQFPITADECHESLDLRTQIAAKQLAKQVAADFNSLWDSAKPQGAGSYTKRWTDQDRTIDFSEKVDDIMRRVRAFGLIECIAKINNVTVYVRRAVGWAEPHDFIPGNLIHIDNMAMVIAANDGFIAVLEWSLLEPNATTGRYLR